jgi:hypothetical protein
LTSIALDPLIEEARRRTRRRRLSYMLAALAGLTLAALWATLTWTGGSVPKGASGIRLRARTGGRLRTS